MSNENIVTTQQQMYTTIDQLATKEDKPDKHSTDSDSEYNINHESCLPICLFIIFTCICIIVGTTIICVTLSKQRDSPCRHIFQKSAENKHYHDSNPYHVATGDFDQDGYSDIVVANTGTDNIGIFHSYGDGTFASQIVYSTGLDSRPRAVAVGDFNNDGYLDIAVADYGINSIGVFLSDGNNSFIDKQILTFLGPCRPVSIAVGHFNNDSGLDIALVSDGVFNVTLLFGLNDGSFDFGQTYDMGYDSMPNAIVAYDLNNDDQMDLAAVNYGTSELVLLVSGDDGTLQVSRYSTGDRSYPLSVAVIDLDGDDVADVVVANAGAKTIGLFIGNGDGTVRNMTIIPVGYRFQPQYIVVGDLNDDQHMDILFLDTDANFVFVLEGSANGIFTNTINFATGANSDPTSMAMGDFDNDRIQDVVITNKGTNNIYIRTSYSRYPASNSVSYPIRDGAAPSYARVADLDNDGDLDLIFSNPDFDTVEVRINLGDRKFAEEEYPMGEDSSPSFLDVVDVNNDGYTDIVVVLSALSPIRILLNRGDGTFNSEEEYSAGDESQPVALAFAHFNNDSYLDIVSANKEEGNIGIYFGLGNGTFTDQTSLLDELEYYPTTVTAGDVNNDGAGDIMISDDQNEDIIILLGYGNGSFQDPRVVSTNTLTVLTHVSGDLNNDNQLDIVYSNVLTSCVIILLGNGDGTFQHVHQYYVTRSSYPWALALGHYDQDQFVDIAVVKRFDASVNVFLGAGNGSMAKVMTLDTPVGSYPQSAVFGDMDNDTHSDLVVADPDTNNILIFFAYGAINFLGTASYTTGAASHPYFMTIASFPNRQSTEVLVANSGTDTIELLSNYNSGAFLNSTILSTGTGSHPQALTVADFNKDQILDIAVVDTWINKMSLYIGLKNGSFNTLYPQNTGSAPSVIASGDLNHDDRMDVVVANANSNTLSVFLAFNYILFSYNYIYVTGSLPVPWFIIADNFDNDTIIDLAVVNANNGRFLIYLGNGNGTFSDPISHLVDSSARPVSLRSGDFNNDTLTDLVVVDRKNNGINVYLGYGNGSFHFLEFYSTDNVSEPLSAAVADLNNDGRLDIIVVASKSNNIYMFEGTGNGSFTRRLAYSTIKPSSLSWISVTDLDNDSTPDIIVADKQADKIQIVFGYGHGTFGDVLLLSTGENSDPISIAIGDLNQDNRLDIVVANQGTSNIIVFFGLGNRTFSGTTIALGTYSYTLQTVYVGDINNDKILDILFANYDPSYSSVGIVYGIGKGRFTVPTIYFFSKKTKPTSIAIGDFNRDGRVDLAVTYSNQDIINIMFQTGFHPFISSTSLSTGVQSSPLAVALQDLNNDTHLDIIVANSRANNIGILFGNGDGTFQLIRTYNLTNHSNPVALAIGHFNDDSYFDIAIVNNVTNTIVIFFGSVNGTLTNMTSYFMSVSSIPVSIVAHDLNIDNATDLVIANRGRNEILVLYGGNNGSFSTRASYSIGYGAHPQSSTIGDMNGDNMLDIIVANEGANYVDVLLQIC